jgi:penicillin-binding protein 2
VLALVSTPTFDPNLFADGITPEAWRTITEDPRRPMLDRTVNSAYAPGSTYKVFVALAGLDSGTITPDESTYCNGSIQMYGAKRLCWKKGGHGRVDLRRAVAHSCNVYFYQLGKRLGIDPIERYSALFGLGEPSGIDLPSEAHGIRPSRSWKQEQRGAPWYPGDTISVAIGQGYLAVTPIQMARAVSAVATRGALPRPHLFADRRPETRRIDISPAAFELVRQAMRDAVQAGTGRNAALETIEVAGKTGTAQVFKHSAGIDADELPKAERDHGWFVGFAPMDRPRIAFAVVVEHGGHGGTSAAVIVQRVLEVFFGVGDRDGEVDDERRAGSVTTDAPPAG